MIRLSLILTVILLFATGYTALGQVSVNCLPLILGQQPAPTLPTTTGVPATGTPLTTPTATSPPSATSTPTATSTTAATSTSTGTSTVTPTPTVTPTATNTPIPPTVTPNPAFTDTDWHIPGAHGNRPPHEHGDAPPQWVLDAGYGPTFTHAANTPNENEAYFSHTAFKGWSGRFHEVDWYGVFHLASNPGGHDRRFHSYQLWLRDQTGAVSYLHGWMDFGIGANSNPNLVYSCTEHSNVRPIMSAPMISCAVLFEIWYSVSLQDGWMPDFGFSINPNYYGGGDPADPSTWVQTGYLRNLARRIEFAWYADRSPLRGEFWATQFGDRVSGPTDPVCGTQRAFGDISYTVLCLKQTIAPSLPTIAFPGNSEQRTFPGPASLPN